jgi:transcriptional regulator with XRE-family HTH domain
MAAGKHRAPIMDSRNNNLCGKRIRYARARAEMSQTELCAALSVDHNIEITQNVVSKIENGIRTVNDIELVALAQALNVTPCFLLYGEERPCAQIKVKN